MATNFGSHECVIFFKSMKIGTHENKAIHIMTEKKPRRVLLIRVALIYPMEGENIHIVITGEWSFHILEFTLLFIEQTAVTETRLFLETCHRSKQKEEKHLK